MSYQAKTTSTVLIYTTVLIKRSYYFSSKPLTKYIYHPESKRKQHETPPNSGIRLPAHHVAEPPIHLFEHCHKASTSVHRTPSKGRLVIRVQRVGQFRLFSSWRFLRG